MISQFFKEDNGNFSSIRLINLSIILTTCFVWIYSTLTKGEWLPSTELIALILGILGAKVWQKKLENE